MLLPCCFPFLFFYFQFFFFLIIFIYLFIYCGITSAPPPPLYPPTPAFPLLLFASQPPPPPPPSNHSTLPSDYLHRHRPSKLIKKGHRLNTSCVIRSHAKYTSAYTHTHTVYQHLCVTSSFFFCEGNCHLIF